MMRIGAICALAALAAGCGPAAETNESAPALVGTARDAAEAEKIAMERRQATRFDWEGRFAATAELCEGGVWNIRRDGIATDGETSCEVRNIDSGADRVDLDLACTAEGMASEERWTLTPRDGGGMRVVRAPTGGAMVAVDLVRC
ncbi:MAG: hypothetical protein ACK4K7_10975 [Allosphingosinicella sp.]|uniref:hypothetical protein n=1 Tax=Allosphingosinicella sp. TaxID=2823234 RepID=UPI0039212E4D